MAIALPTVLLGESLRTNWVIPTALLGEFTLTNGALPRPGLTDAPPHYIDVSGGVAIGGGADIALDPYIHTASGGVLMSGSATEILLQALTGSSTVVSSSSSDLVGSFSDEGLSSAAAVSLAEGTLFLYVVAESSAGVTSEAFAPSIFFEAVDSVVSALGGAEAYRLIEGVVASNAQVTGSADGAATYYVTAESFAEIISSLQFVADFHDGWAYNLNTGAPSFYEGFKFNSFAKVGNEYFGCNADGIFKLSGGTDNGVPIKATITTGMNGDKGIYRVDALYAGARSELPMNLTCRVEGREHTYAFQSSTDTLEPTRVTPGKGLRGRYWQFEITNQDGADIEIDALEALISPASRRV